MVNINSYGFSSKTMSEGGFDDSEFSFSVT